MNRSIKCVCVVERDWWLHLEASLWSLSLFVHHGRRKLETKAAFLSSDRARKFTRGRHCCRQLNGSVKRPCEGAGGQHNLIPLLSADCSSWLYLQHILAIWSVLSEIRVCSLGVLHTVCLHAARFYRYLTNLLTRLRKWWPDWIYQSAQNAERSPVFHEVSSFPRKSIFLFSKAINVMPRGRKMLPQISYLQL